jgi:hypothetical protein
VAPTVLYDACVLYPAPLRDLLMRLALANLFQARWTDEIHDEWTRNVAANRPDVSAESLARCRKLMNEHVTDSLIIGYEALIPSLSLPDSDDRHVLAAAIHGGAGVIRTIQTLLGHRNLKTTAIYTHVSPAAVEATQSPLDRLATLPGESRP